MSNNQHTSSSHSLLNTTKDSLNSRDTSLNPHLPFHEMHCPFQPSETQKKQMPLFEQGQVPRYLIRVYSETSEGRTSLLAAEAPSVANEKLERIKDIFKLEPKEATKRLNEHLRWDSRHEDECNFISWTNSLLFALQYALYKHKGARKTSKLSGIFILILDTQHLPVEAFVKDTEIMDVFARFSDLGNDRNLNDLLQLRKANKGYYFGEYLTQGCLNLKGCCVETTMQRLIDGGLYELRPELEDKTQWDKWAKRVVDLRQNFQLSREGLVTSRTEVRKAITIAEACFGGSWTVPLAAMLLSLRSRKQNDSVIVDGFAAMFTDKEIKELSLETLYMGTEKVPETEQFQNLINDISTRFATDIDQLNNLLSDFRITN